MKKTKKGTLRLTSLPEGSHNHASLFPMPESEKGKTTTVISGQNIIDLLESCGRPGLLRKTLLASSVWKMSPHLKSGYSLEWKVKTVSEESIRDISIVKGRLMFLTRSLKILKERIIPSKRIIFQLAVSGRGTKEKGSGLSDTEPQLWRTPEAGDSANRTFAVNSRGEPKLSAQVKMFPTPAARDYRTQHKENSEAFKARLTHSRGVNLVEQLQRDGNTGQLNPTWVEWLMGYPEGWTDLKDLETQ